MQLKYPGQQSQQKQLSSIQYPTQRSKLPKKQQPELMTALLHRTQSRANARAGSNIQAIIQNGQSVLDMSHHPSEVSAIN